MPCVEKKNMRSHDARHRNGCRSASSNRLPSGQFTDKDALQRYQGRLDQLACAVEGVALGYTPGLYCFGGPGTGKSHMVTASQSQRVEGGRHHLPQKGGLTAGGLLKLLEKNSVKHNDRHLVIDDAGDLVSDRRMMQYLLAALDGVGERIITYTSDPKDREVLFRKGVILLSNLALPQHNNGIIRAFQDRVPVLELDPPDDERAAMLLYLADTQVAGRLNPNQRREAAETVLEFAETLGIRPTLRDYFQRAVPFYQQDLDGNSRLHWRDRLWAAMALTATVPQRASRAQTQAKLRAQAAEIAAKYHEPTAQLAAWRALGPGHSQASWYRHRPLVTPQAQHHDAVAEELETQLKILADLD
jgi:hypothetical protein